MPDLKKKQEEISKWIKEVEKELSEKRSEWQRLFANWRITANPSDSGYKEQLDQYNKTEADLSRLTNEISELEKNKKGLEEEWDEICRKLTQKSSKKRQGEIIHPQGTDFKDELNEKRNAIIKAQEKYKSAFKAWESLLVQLSKGKVGDPVEFKKKLENATNEVIWAINSLTPLVWEKFETLQLMKKHKN